MSETPQTVWTLEPLKTEQGTIPILTPHNDFSGKLIAETYPMGTMLRARFIKPRSIPHHHLYWAVLQEVVEATGAWATVEDLHTAIKLHLRMVQEIRMIQKRNGEVETRFLPRSIAFDKMDQAEFRLFFKKAMLAIEESTGINTDELIAAFKAKNPGYVEPWMRGRE